MAVRAFAFAVVAVVQIARSGAVPAPWNGALARALHVSPVGVPDQRTLLVVVAAQALVRLVAIPLTDEA